MSDVTTDVTTGMHATRSTKHMIARAMRVYVNAVTAIDDDVAIGLAM